MMPRATRTENAILTAFGLAVVAILSLGWVLFQASQEAIRSQAMVQRTEQVLRRIAGLRESLALAEAGHRGFLITGAARFRDASEQARAQLVQHGEALEREVTDNPLQRDRSRRLAGMIDERIGIMRRTERLQGERGSAAAHRYFGGGLPEQAGERIRGLVAEMADEETRLLSARRQHRQQSQAAMRRMLLVAGIVVLALLVPVLWGIVRQSRGRRQAESRLRVLAHGLPGTVYIYRMTPEGIGRYDFLSINAGELLGIDREQALRDAVETRRAVLEEDRDRLVAAVARSARELSDLEVDFRIRKPDGAIRWLRSSGIPVRQSNGDVVWNGYWSDITDVKDTEQALRDATRRLEDAQSVAGIGDWTCDLATGAVTWSRQVYTMLQRDPAAGTPDLEEGVALFENGAEATAEAFFKAQETGEPQAYEMSARLPDGSIAKVHVIAVPSRDDTGAIVGMHGTIQDITARKALEERLSLAKEAADNANRAKSIFLATMSHEIRTHLNGMLGILELITLNPLNAELRSALEGVRESGKSLQQIIDDILDFSKVEAGKLDIRPEPASIEDIVAGVHRTFAGSASSLGLDMRHVVDPRISPAVMVDALRLRQILSNFASNAIKFTPKGHVELRARLLERHGDHERLCFEVEDTGIGVPPEHQQRLFQPFEQAEDTTAIRFGGTGLGLSISRRLAELMGGEVGMSSAVGKGTTMSLVLTVAVADPERLARHGKAAEVVAAMPPAIDMDAPSAAQAADEGTLVLVVDDHPVNRMVMRRQLNTLGYAAEEAESGAEALALWNTGRFGLVLTDCNMPEMSGYELSQRIREAEAARGGPRTPIVACSANVIHGVRQACRDAGMDDYISKPTELVPLAEIMRRWLPLPGQELAGAIAAVDPRGEGEPAESDGPLDGRALHAASKGDPVAAQRMIEHFRRVNDADVAGLADAVERGDSAAVTRLAHRIKGACGFIGATDLASVCAMLEQAGRAGDARAIERLMTGFRSELERLNAYLDAQRPR